MPVLSAATRSARAFHAALLTGVSALALLVHATPAQARCIGPCAAGSTGAVTAAMSSAITSAQQAAFAAQQSASSLARATLAVQALQATQAMARQAALAGPNNLGADPNHPGQQLPNVPDGLAIGGLVPDSGLAAPGQANSVLSQNGGTWVGANTPSQTTNGQGVIVSINQTQPTALLNWTTFNVGKNTLVNFNQQGNANWVALNRITDPSGVPSQILGHIKADGQVVLINRNGIIFGGSSQVNVHTLIASTEDIDESNATYLSNGLFSDGIPQNVPGITSSVITGSVNFNVGNTGAITVQPGAIIDTTQNVTSTGDGGYVALIGGTGMTNAGMIATQNGQIILAGGGTSLYTPSSTLVGVGTALQVIAAGAPVTNTAGGLLVSNDGAVTIAGSTISNFGGIEATTSTTRTGSITINTAGAPNNAGNIILASGSLLAILPDETSGPVPTATVNSTIAVNFNSGPYFQEVLQPQITITANSNIDVQSGAFIKAPGAAMTVSAGTSQGPGSQGTVLFEPGSIIDLSGLAGVTLPMSINQVSILITDNEVADDPLARSLIKQTVTIDARLSGTNANGTQWVGSPILDASGYVGLIPETIDQVLTVGGSINVSAKNFVQQPGSLINISGGYVTYQGGTITTTMLIGSDGRIYNIGGFPNNIAVVGIAGQTTVDHAHWGVSDVFINRLISGAQFNPGYIAGASAGSVSVNAFVPILQGSIVGNVEVGSRQAAAAIGGGTTQQATLSQLPREASLNIGFAAPGGQGSSNPYNVVIEPQADAGADPYGLAAGGFSLTNAKWAPGLSNGAFPIFSDLLTSDEFGSISIQGANQLKMTADATVSVLPGGSIAFNGVSSIAGTLNAPGGSINLTGFTYISGVPQQPPTSAVVIGPSAVLNVRGLWVNDTGLSGDQIQGPAFINGGSVSITTIAASNSPSFNGGFIDVTQSIVLSPGSVIDVSSGGYVGPTGKLAAGSDGLPKGKAGSVKITAYNGGWSGPPTPGFPAPFNVFPQLANGTATDPTAANVVLGGAIYAYGFDGGGTFSLQAPTITIDSGTSQATSITSGPNAGTVVLPPSFFASGFSQYTLTSTVGSITVTPGTQLVLSEPVLKPTGIESAIPTGASARSVAPVALAPAFLRPAASLTLDQSGYIQASSPPNDPAATAGILLGLGASISTDPGGTISLIGAGPVTVLGDITAPGGGINLVNISALSAAEDVWIGSDAVLNVSGVYIPKPLTGTFSFGTLLNGGTITMMGLSPANNSLPANMIVQPGAEFLLDGVAANVNIGTGSLGSSLRSQLIWSNGGTLQLAASGVARNNSLYFAGAVDARGGVDPATGHVLAPLATGGTLTIGNIVIPNALSSYVSPTVNSNTIAGPSTIVIESSGVVAANLPPVSAGSFPTTQAQLTAVMPPSPGGYIGADTLSKSGFDSINLNSTGSIAFNGSLTVAVPGALTLQAAGSGSLVLLRSSSTLLPTGVTDPANYTPPACTPAGSCVPSIGAPTITLQAGYVQITGRTASGQGGSLPAPTLANGTLNVSAQWIDLERAIALDNVLNANFTSSGAIRFLPDNYGFNNGLGASSQAQFAGALVVPGNLNLSAAEIYPVSNTQFLLMSLGNVAGANTLTINQNGSAVGPLSAGGTIILDAVNIQQNGTLWAPLGSIVLGLQNVSQIPTELSLVYGNNTTYTGPLVVTQNVTLGPNSLTSVSANGLYIPDGYTVDGTSWYQGTGNQNNPGDVAGLLTAPPAKSIGIFAANITTGGRLDASGGGDIYAVEFVAGTGGNRNVLTTYEQSLPSSTGSSLPSYTPQYADGRQVYALVPTYEAPVGAYDPGFADYPFYSGDKVPTGTVLTNVFISNAIAPGSAVTISGGQGIAAGTYTLLPGMYATLPGAYRVVQTAGNVVSSPISTTTADGSLLVTGYTSNALTGARSSQQALFQIQSNAVWTKYSQINITSGTSFFRSQALAAGIAPPPLPIDGGQLILAATRTLNLGSSNAFGGGTSNMAPGLTGLGGQVEISSSNILILAPDQTEPVQDATSATPYLVLNADQISALGVPSVLIGGSVSFASGQEVITANALNVEVETDAAHPLTAPDLILVSKAGSNGITVDAGSVIAAVGTASVNTSGITIGGAGVSGDGSLLRVSNAAPVAISRTNLPTTTTGNIAIGTTAGTANLVAGANVSISGTNITIDSSGNNSFAPDLTNPDGSVRAHGVSLQAQNYTLSASVINIGGGTSGLVLDPSLIAEFSGATSVSLRSASVINLFDASGLVIGDPNNRIGTLTFDGAGLYDNGGTTTIYAGNIDLINSRGVTAGTGPAFHAAGGTLNFNASGTITEDAGAKSLVGFGTVNWNAGQSIDFSGTGSVDTGPALAASFIFDVGSIAVQNGGSGYSTAPTVTISGGGGTGATATAVVTNGVITGFTITNPGSGYTSMPTVTISGGGGSGATAQALGSITNVTLTGGQVNALGSAVNMAISGGGGAGATAVATVSGGSVGGVLVTNGGSGFTSVPTLMFETDMTLTAPALVVNGGSTQALTTPGTVTILPQGTAPTTAPTNFGGALTLTGRSIIDSGTITALSGNVALAATAGDIVLQPGAALNAGGSHLTLLDVTEDTPGGTVTLSAPNGSIAIEPGASISVAATGLGFAGNLSIQTGATGTTTLAGTLDGGAAFKDLGGNLSVQTGTLLGNLQFEGFGGSIAVSVNGRGEDLVIPAGTVLSSDNVLLVANNGSVIVNGTIDASSPSGGQIALYGAGLSNGGIVTGGVVINAGAVLRAAYAADDPNDPASGNGEANLAQNGGTITLGTTGIPSGSYDTTGCGGSGCGYQTVTQVFSSGTVIANGSGAITVASGATLDVSGGAAGSGGNVILRAPIRNVSGTDKNGNAISYVDVNVAFNGTVVGTTAGPNSGVGLDAYAVWSTTDATSGGQHFDGIIDPAGFFDGSGNQIISPTGGLYPTSTAANPAAGAYLPHVNFYQTTLLNFVQDLSLANVTANMRVQPEIDLVNPSSTINGGNITVASNWNLGAGVYNLSTGAYSLFYRTTNGSAPGVLSLRASNNIQVNATISDGFYETSDPFFVPQVALFNGVPGLTDPSLSQATGIYSADATFITASFMPGDQFISAPPTAFPASYNQLDQNVWYGQYYFFYMGEGIRSLNLVDGAASSRYITTGASGTAFDSNPNDYASYAAYVAAYNANYAGIRFLTGEVATTAVRPNLSSASPARLKSQTVATFDNNPTDYGSYADYALAYRTYANAMKTVIANYYSTHTSLAGPFPSTLLAPVPPVFGATYANGSKETATLYASDYGTGYLGTTNSNSAYLDYVSFYSGSKVEPGDTTGANSITATTTNPLWIVALPYLPSTSAQPAVAIATGAVPTLGNSIANNPGNNVTTDNLGNPLTIADFNTTSAANALMTGASFSYNFVGGAYFPANGAASVNPDAVVPVGALSGAVTGNVTINGHTSYPDGAINNRTIDVPTLVRTGTGSITIAAAGNFELLDQTTPGAVYTAGAAAPTPGDFTAPAVPLAVKPNGLVSTPTWTSGGGAVTITTGQSIIGLETPIDDANGDQTGLGSTSTAQFWSDWYMHFGKANGTVNPFQACATAGSAACQTAAWVNFATFFQGIGALGGGNVTLTAGGNIADIGASLPETIFVSGGFAGDAAVEHVLGGGNLLVKAAGNLLSSDFMVGRGAGLIQVGGSVQQDTSNPITGLPTQLVNPTFSNITPLPLLLAVQDGFVTVAARGSVTLGNVFDPASVIPDNGVQTVLTNLPGATPGTNQDQNFGTFFTTYGPGSGVSLLSTTGDVTAVTLTADNLGNLFAHNPNTLLTDGFGASAIGHLFPATLEATAYSGNITVDPANSSNANLVPYPTLTGSDTGTITLVAAQSITMAGGLAMPDLTTSASQFLGNGNIFGNYISPLGIPMPNLTEGLHANDANPVILTAGRNITEGSVLASLQVIKPAEIEAGNNIQIPFIGQNNNTTDITSLIAGNNMQGGAYELYGPGAFLLEAGGNMGNINATTLWGGVFAVGNGSNISGSAITLQHNLSSGVVPYLPKQGATIDLLFGIKPGIDYAAAITAFGDPSAAAKSGMNFLPPVVSQLDELVELLIDQRASAAGIQNPQAEVILSPSDAAAVFQALSSSQIDQVLNNLAAKAGFTTLTFNLQPRDIAALQIQQQQMMLSINRAFLDFLTQVGVDYHNASSPYYQQYARAYQAIGTLFPASLGYTDNGTGVGNGAAAMIKTGSLDISRSAVETQMGGDINILGPGGGIIVGATSRDVIPPSGEGILTLAGGTINVFTDGSILVNQSRIMTEQGGDINMFSANGDIAAGEGPKTYASDPPIVDICDVNGYCHVNPSGLVTGAGIAALVTLPGQDSTKSNAVLTAPHGTIDAGPAGIRVAGNLTLSPRVLNAYNIQVQGTITGLPTFTGPNTVALTTASNVAGANQISIPAPTNNKNQPSIIIVEVVGYGGGGDDSEQPNQPRKTDGRQGYNYDQTSPFQVLGTGELSESQTEALIQEKGKLVPH